MMMSEFIERTGYEPSFEEYTYIEDSYYEFEGNKDEFCKAWLKDKKSGVWAKEMKLRKEIYDQREELNKKIAEQEENLEFYRKAHDEQRNKIKDLEAAQRGGAVVNITVNGKLNHYEHCDVKYVDNGHIKFLRVDENGWITCYRVEDIEEFEVR